MSCDIFLNTKSLAPHWMAMCRNGLRQLFSVRKRRAFVPEEVRTHVDVTPPPWGHHRNWSVESLDLWHCVRHFPPQGPLQPSSGYADARLWVDSVYGGRWASGGNWGYGQWHPRLRCLSAVPSGVGVRNLRGRHGQAFSRWHSSAPWASGPATALGG